MIYVIGIEDEQFASIAAEIAKAAFDEEKMSGDAAVEFAFAEPAEIRELNARARGVDKETDVLSFPALTEIKPFTRENYPYEYNDELGAVELGSVVVCKAVAEAQAEEYGHSLRRELCYLFAHGLMHLCGYDHIEESDRAIMRDKEERVLSEVGVTRED